MYKVNEKLSSCDITYSGRVSSRESDIHNGLSKSAQNFTDGFLQLLSTHPIHNVVWENFPFKQDVLSYYNGGMEYTISRPTFCYSVF